MHPFEETISVAGAVVTVIIGGIIVLALFFKALSWLGGGAKPETMSVRGVLGKSTYAAVHFVGGETFERVRFVGFLNSGTMKTHLPFELNGMVILEDAQKKRYLVRAKNIRMIVIAPDAA